MTYIQVWNEHKIQEGFQRFYNENGHFPTASEIDKCSYLPSSREIQRNYGGLIKFRTKLGLRDEDINYSQGKFRSNIASVSNKISLTAEKTVSDFLTNLYGEICVHEQKKYGDGKNTVDFFVYGKTANFGVEVFNTYTLRDLSGNLNIKLKKYYDFPYRLCFVVMGGDFKQEDIDKLVSNKKHLPLLTNMTCMKYEVFKEKCFEITLPLEINTNYYKFVDYQVKYTKKV